MRKLIYLLVAACVTSTTVLGANLGKSAVSAAKSAAVKGKEFGGQMPLPVDQRIERQNSAEDKLVVEVSHSAQVNGEYVAYVKIVWGDLDNVIKKNGPEHYSKWDGNLKLDALATGAIDQEIQFEDGSKAKPGAKATKTVTTKATPKLAAKPKVPTGPHEGSGKDAVEVKTGPDVAWEAGVVGALDGLRIKITSPYAPIDGTLTAGKFVIPIHITGGAGNAVPVKGLLPATGGATGLQVK